jgi:hypothetical protein
MPMKKQHTDLAGLLLMETRNVRVEVHSPRIASCLRLLYEEEIWWLPKSASNSVGNLA